MVRKRFLTVVAVLSLPLAFAPMHTSARGRAGEVAVMTRNLFVGSDLTPVIAATTPEQFLAAVSGVLQTIAANDFPQRSVALAREIADKKPDLVALQEVYRLTLNDSTGAPPYRDMLQDLMDALAEQGAQYSIVGEVRNLDVTIPAPGLGLIRAIDRDVVLARSDVPAIPTPVPGCRASADGCNYQVFAAIPTPGGTINIERGFIVVDAFVAGQAVRLVNTHLEVPELPRVIQSLQAAELIARVQAIAQPGLHVVIAGDINSAPTEGDVITGNGVLLSAYHQLVAAGYADTWTLRPGRPPGLTCCQANDLRNLESQLFKRVDVIFSGSVPAETHVNLLGVDPDDKTASGLWPSDHAGLVARLRFDQ